MCQVQNDTLFDFVCVYILCDCFDIDFRLTLGAICFQRCVGNSVCMHLCVCLWYLSSTCKPSAHTPSLAVVHPWIGVLPPWQRYHPKRQTASPWFNKLPRESQRGGEALWADNCPPCKPSFFLWCQEKTQPLLLFCVNVYVCCVCGQLLLLGSSANWGSQGD